MLIQTDTEQALHKLTRLLFIITIILEHVQSLANNFEQQIISVIYSYILI